ncbi:MAG: YkgJ family cysteine cluster protein [Bacteroidales bacterium]
MTVKLNELPQSAKLAEKGSKKLFAHLKKNTPNDLDIKAKEFHEKAFLDIDCLDCANCCKNISPMITDKDIERIAKFLKIRPSAFTEKYLHMDEDNDYVFNSSPCPFLDNDNYCKVYDVRPKACSEYPHTNRKRFVQILGITLKNTFICPAAYEVVEKLKEKYK